MPSKAVTEGCTLKLPPIKCHAKLVQTALNAQPIFRCLPLPQDFGKNASLKLIF